MSRQRHVSRGAASIAFCVVFLLSAVTLALGIKNGGQCLPGYAVIVEEGENSFGAYVPDSPGCAAVGETREEVLRLIQEAIEFHLEGLRVDGRPIPEPSSGVEFVDVRAA